MKMEPIVITLNVRADGENPHVAKEFAERLMKAISLPTVAEQDAEQWVYLESRRDGMHYRIRPDGTDPQWWDDEEWNDERVDADWVECYCKGREVALAEDAELREQVKALVDAVLDADDRPCCRYSSGRTDPWPKDWERITAIARAVQL